MGDVGMVRVRVVYVMCMSRVVVCICGEVCGYDVGAACVHKEVLDVCDM